MVFAGVKDLDPFAADSFKKHKIKTHPNMCILMYFKTQSDQPKPFAILKDSSW